MSNQGSALWREALGARRFSLIEGEEHMKKSWHGFVVVSAVTLGGALWPAMAQQTQTRQQPVQQQHTQQAPQQQTRPATVPAHQSAADHLNAAAQGPRQAAGTIDGSHGNASTPVHVQPSTSTVNAATIAAQQNAAERARQAAVSRKINLDNRPVPSPGSR
jgi:cytoskeletal protein RodZ